MLRKIWIELPQFLRACDFKKEISPKLGFPYSHTRVVRSSFSVHIIYINLTSQFQIILLVENIFPWKWAIP